MKEQEWMDKYDWDMLFNDRRAYTGGDKRASDKRYRNSETRKKWKEENWNQKEYDLKRQEWIRSWGGGVYGLHKIKV